VVLNHFDWIRQIEDIEVEFEWGSIFVHIGMGSHFPLVVGTLGVILQKLNYHSMIEEHLWIILAVASLKSLGGLIFLYLGHIIVVKENIEEVRSFIFSPGLSFNFQDYALTILLELILDKTEGKVPKTVHEKIEIMGLLTKTILFDFGLSLGWLHFSIVIIECCTLAQPFHLASFMIQTLLQMDKLFSLLPNQLAMFQYKLFEEVITLPICLGAEASNEHSQREQVMGLQLNEKMKESLVDVNVSIVNSYTPLILTPKEYYAFVFELPKILRFQFKRWDPGGHVNPGAVAWFSKFKQWDPGQFIRGSDFYNLEDTFGLEGLVMIGYLL